jgi:hypothetical protein
MYTLPVVLVLLEKGYVKLRRGSVRVHRAYASCVEVKNSLSSKFQEKRKKCSHTSFEVFASSEGITLVECRQRVHPSNHSYV